MRTPIRLLAVAASLVTAVGLLTPAPAPADSAARLLVVDHPTAKLKVVPTGAQLTFGADVTNTTKNRQPASTLRVYLRTVADPQAPGRVPAQAAVHRYRVVDKRVRAIDAGDTVGVTAVVIAPDKVPAGTYTVRICIERLLYRNCEFTPNDVVIAPARIVLTPSEHDFGTVDPEFPQQPPRGTARRETSTHTFTVTNKGVAVSGVPGLTLSGDSFAFDLGATTCESPLHRNETCTVDVTFGYPESGQFTATLTAAAAPGGEDGSALSGVVQFSD